MRGLGLAGAGLGAAAATMPVFHDLDEVVSSPNGKRSDPWWVREVDENTTPVDWNIMQSFDATRYNNFSKQYSPEEQARIGAEAAETRLNNLLAKTPGSDIRAVAISRQNVHLFRSVVDDFYTGHTMYMKAAPYYEVYGVPKWQGTPEENARMMRTLFRYWGAYQVGFADVNATTRKLNAKGIVYTDDVEAYKIDGSFVNRVMPNSFRTAIAANSLRLFYTNRCTRSVFDGMGMHCGEIDYATLACARFLKDIGYHSCGMDSAWYVAPGRVGWMALAGLGEMGRIQQNCTWEYGYFTGADIVVFTDLPCAPAKPIDFGHRRFCQTCTTCADNCPYGAIPTRLEPSWDIYPQDPDNPYHDPTRFNNPGLETWYYDHSKCILGLARDGKGCHNCAAHCPFSKDTAGSVHELVKAISSQTTVFNSFFTKLDKAFGYGPLPEEKRAELWDLEDRMPQYGQGALVSI